MFNYNNFKKAVKRSGYQTQWLQEQLGLSKQAYYNRVHNRVMWRQAEISLLKILLKLSDDEATNIFFFESKDIA